MAAAALFGALVFAVTWAIPPIAIPATSGYFNVGETAIYTAALIFGPLTGALSGGIGAMIADALLAPQFAAGTLVIKGIEGALVGAFSLRLRRVLANRLVCDVAAILAGGFEMVAGYFLYEVLVLGYPTYLALVEVPFNIVQMAVGMAVAIPVVHAVRRVVPTA